MNSNNIFDPSSDLLDQETTHLFLCYCTLVMNLQGKKMSIQNVFVHTLENVKMMKILKEILTIDTEYEIVKIFLDYDPTIAKSKYVTKWLNSNNKK